MKIGQIAELGYQVRLLLADMGSAARLFLQLLLSLASTLRRPALHGPTAELPLAPAIIQGAGRHQADTGHDPHDESSAARWMRTHQSPAPDCQIMVLPRLLLQSQCAYDPGAIPLFPDESPRASGWRQIRAAPRAEIRRSNAIHSATGSCRPL